ncbi:reverse transcriptase-like protein [Sphingomonas tabacisoli]|uniref:Reverse transcriptase-like protein n=1 Tax=Sphingomonas tabacisoli TaxID=2249466 RepID=A0ABW4I3W5_9SPHN
METAVVVKGRTYIQRGLGVGTSMDAEWLALIHAVKIAHDMGLSDPIFLGDALAVVNQANGTVKCREAFVRHLAELETLRVASAPLNVRYVKRTQNLAGIALARDRNGRHAREALTKTPG